MLEHVRFRQIIDFRLSRLIQRNVDIKDLGLLIQLDVFLTELLEVNLQFDNRYGRRIDKRAGLQSVNTSNCLIQQGHLFDHLLTTELVESGR